MRPNPLLDLRNSLLMSQEKVLKDLQSLSAQSLRRYEQGIYPHPSQELISYYIEKSEGLILLEDWPAIIGTNHQVTNAYHDWQVEKRIDSAKFFRRGAKFPVTRNMHPITTYRTLCVGPSRMTFCKLLAINPSMVAHYEEGKGVALPIQLKGALEDAQVNPRTLEDLETRCVAYQHFKLHGQQIPGELR